MQNIMSDPLLIDTQYKDSLNTDNQHNDSKHNYTQYGRQLFHDLGHVWWKKIVSFQLIDLIMATITILV